MAGRLEGKTALITGGTSGIGRNAAVRFALEGAKVLFTGRDETRAAETIAMAKDEAPEAEVFFEPQEVAVEDDWKRVIAAARQRFGQLDILVNNAGVFFLKTIEDTTPADFLDMWRINVEGVFLGTKYALGWMRENPAGGAIVNVASLSGLVGHELCSGYCTTKAGAIMLTKAAALDAAPKVRVNAVAPGPIWNELLERQHAENAEEMKNFYVETSPLKLLGLDSDVTNALVYLSSDESRAITGTVLRVDAGRGAD